MASGLVGLGETPAAGQDAQETYLHWPPTFKGSWEGLRFSFPALDGTLGDCWFL